MVNRVLVLPALSISALFAAGFVGAPPASAKPTVLEPISQWAVDFGDERCRLARLFGSEDRRHILFFDQYGPSTTFFLTVAGRSFRRFKSREETSIQFYAIQEPRETEPFVGRMDGFGNALVYAQQGIEAPPSEDDRLIRPPSFSTSGALPQLDLQDAKKVEFLTFVQSGRQVRLEVGELASAFEVLNQCSEGLLQGWGLDTKAHRTARRFPRWTNEKEITERIVDRYPTAALIRGEQSINDMRVIVSETGSVLECVIQEATEAEKLRSPACEEMEDAVFEPALDANGRPMKSYYRTRVTYRIND